MSSPRPMHADDGDDQPPIPGRLQVYDGNDKSRPAGLEDRQGAVRADAVLPKPGRRDGQGLPMFSDRQPQQASPRLQSSPSNVSHSSSWEQLEACRRTTSSVSVDARGDEEAADAGPVSQGQGPLVLAGNDRFHSSSETREGRVQAAQRGEGGTNEEGGGMMLSRDSDPSLLIQPLISVGADDPHRTNTTVEQTDARHTTSTILDIQDTRTSVGRDAPCGKESNIVGQQLAQGLSAPVTSASNDANLQRLQKDKSFWRSMASFFLPRAHEEAPHTSEEDHQPVAQEKALSTNNSAQEHLKGIFNRVREFLLLQKDNSHMMDWENLFISISGERDQPINVNADLGETLIRLGIHIDLRGLQETIHKICQARGRDPDEWQGAGVSLKVPVYHELNCDEFIDVMALLTKEEDHMAQARQIFQRFDTNGNGVISATIFSATLQSMGIHKQEGERGYLEIFDEAIRDSSLSQATDLDFETFMFIMGLQGSNEDYVAMEIDDRRRRLTEALTTFHMFDEDGGGSIDAAEIKNTMRAMGKKMSDAEVTHMIAVADPYETGEIDFEHFCYVVLQISQQEFIKCIQAHIQKPIQLEESSDVINVRRKTLEQLCPAVFQRAMLGDSADTPVGKPAVSKKEEDKNQKFILQDLGQYGYLVTKHPFLDENSSTYKPEFVKRAISRPLSLVVQKETSLVTHAAMCPSGLKLALTTSEGILRLYDLRGQKPKQVYYTSAHDHMALCLAWLPDGSGLFTGGADWTVRMWSGEDLSFLGSEMRHLGYVRCVATSHDGNWAASGSSDLAILLFSTSPFKYDDVKLQGHTSWVRWVHFSHDNNRLISGGDDQTIIIWNMMTHNQMQTLRAHSHTISAGVSLPNNKLFTAGFDENLLLWSQDTGLLGYLKVFVAEAFDLPRSDILSGSMSNQRFAKIELGKGQQFETKFKSGRNPQWYEEFNLDVWNVDEHVSIEIYDWDKDEQHRFLASLSVPVEELVCADEGITDREYDMLDEEGNLSKSLISVRFTFRHVRCTGELTVNVEKARDLPRMDTFGLADPFAALTCGKGTRYKTQVKKNSLNPIWNEEFIFNVEENARELKIVLYDWSITKEEDFIGQVLIPTSDIEANPYRDEWFKLKDLDGTTDVKGEVKLCIQFIPESERDSTAIRFRRNPASWPVGEKADFNHFAPVGQIKLFGRTILRGDGRIRVSILSTGQQIACWTAHAGPVAGLQFANGDDRLVSWGPDCRGVTLSDYSHGSYMPANASNRETGKRSSVEVWYVASMICAVEIYKKKMMGIVETFEDNEEKNEDNESDDDEAFSLADLDEDDDDDETLTAEERAEKKSEREKRLAKQALSLSRRRGKGGQLGSMPGARVGYTPVYYPPPMLPDGSHARSCLKGRGRQEAMRAGLSWGETEFDNLEIHFYPPENPVEGEGESDDSDSTPSKNKRNQGANAAAKKKRTEEIARERARKRQMEKDIELFGKPVSVQRSQSVSPERPREGDESPTRVSSPDPIASVSLTRTSSDESIRSPSITSPGAGSKQRGRAKLSPYGKNQHEQEQENLEDDFGLVTISADTVAAEKKQKSPKGRKEEGKSPKKSAKSQSTPPEVPAEGAKKPKSKSVSKSTADASSSETPKKAKKAGRKSSPKNPEES